MTHRAEAGQAASLASLPQSPHAPVPLPSPTQAGLGLGTSSLLLMKWAGSISGVFPVVTDESPHLSTQPQGSPQAGLSSHFQPHLLMTLHMPRALAEVERAPFLLESASRGSSPWFRAHPSMSGSSVIGGPVFVRTMKSRTPSAWFLLF